jgi:folate-dependent phosphoribosylglycinamide formyltransferase PurN
MAKKINIGALISGGGTNLQAITAAPFDNSHNISIDA